MNFIRVSFAAFALAVVLSGCPGPTNNPPADGGNEPTDGGSNACTTFATEHERLLNAPTSATAVKKDPKHPALLPDGGLP